MLTPEEARVKLIVAKSERLEDVTPNGTPITWSSIGGQLQSVVHGTKDRITIYPFPSLRESLMVVPQLKDVPDGSLGSITAEQAVALLVHTPWDELESGLGDFVSEDLELAIEYLDNLMFLPEIDGDEFTELLTRKYILIQHLEARNE